MRKLLITLIIAMAVACQSDREPIQRTYLGVTLGKTTMAEAKEALAGYELDATTYEGVQVLGVMNPTISGIKYQGVGFFFGSGVTDSICFLADAQQLEPIKRMLAGDPVKSVRSGCDTYTWQDDSTEAQLTDIDDIESYVRLIIRNINL